MESSDHETDQGLKRIRFFGVVFIVIGLCFSIHGGLNLLEIYNRETSMFELEAVFTPEKGRMWSELLAGLSVSLLGVLVGMKAVMNLKKENIAE